jgi:hypothetical protein
MKKCLIESNISNFIKDKLGIDLSDRIHMVTNQYELPMEFDWIISSKALNIYLNQYGPMYVFEGKKNTYLGQPRKNKWFVVDKRDSEVSELDVMKDLGIEMLGLSLNDLVSQYINETNKKSMNYVITESQLERLSQEIELADSFYGSVEETNFVVGDLLTEAEYKGRKVKLGKIMQGDVKKFKVYVKNDKGNVVKVNFGFGGKSAHGKRMVIKKNNPARRKSFRARHHCETPGPRWKSRFWACKTW